MPGLLDYNPASHLVWHAAWWMLGLLGLFLLIDAVDWPCQQLRQRHRRP